MTSTIENSFKSFIKSYLKKEKGLQYEDGLTIGNNYKIDCLLRDDSGYYTHIFEIKESFSHEGIKQLNRYRAFSYVGRESRPTHFVLACYNGGDWHFYDKDGLEVPVDKLFSGLDETKPLKSITSSLLKRVCFGFSGLLILLCLFDIFSPLFWGEPVHISSQVGLLLCTAGVFAILPLVYPRVKLVQLGSVKLVLVPNDQAFVS